MEAVATSGDVKDTFFYGENDEEESDESSSGILHNIYLAAVMIAILMVTAVLYFGLNYLNLGQYWSSFRWLKLLIPAFFLIASSGAFYLHLRNREAEAIAEEKEEEIEERMIEDIPRAIADALAKSGKLKITFKRKVEATIGIRLLVIMAKIGEIEFEDGDVCMAMLEKFADERKWRKDRDQTIKIILTEQFGRESLQCHNCRCLKERLAGIIEEIDVV